MSRRSRREDDEDDDGLDSARLDVWLWRARFFKTRPLANAVAEQGRVRVTRNGQVLRGRKPGFAVEPGDILSFSRSGKVVCIEILAIPHRRGPASEAQALYRPADLGDTSP